MSCLTFLTLENKLYDYLIIHIYMIHIYDEEGIYRTVMISELLEEALFFVNDQQTILLLSIHMVF